MTLEDFKEENEEDRTQGDESYEKEVWEDGFDDPNKDDDDAVEAGTIAKDETVGDVAKVETDVVDE